MMLRAWLRRSLTLHGGACRAVANQPAEGRQRRTAAVQRRTAGSVEYQAHRLVPGGSRIGVAEHRVGAELPQERLLARRAHSVALLGLADVGLDRRIGQLSGGESVLLWLAAKFLRAPPVLLLDEPTNNLDIASMNELTGSLESYRGALIVASHDLPFLRELGITRWLRLDGNLTEIDPWSQHLVFDSCVSPGPG